MRLIVVQGDTEPASVEQQRVLGDTAPRIYDLRNLFQVNVEEGRHLWAMVYLLHAYFGREGREEAEQLLKRNSGDLDAPRILGAFNEETTDWLQFFMFTYFTDRDGKYQLGTLKESAFDPLARTCEFMLKEEAHHMFVGTTGVQRVVERTAEVMTDNGGTAGFERRRDPARGDPEVPQLPVLGLDGPLRLRAVHQRRQLLLLGPQGPLAGDPAQGRPRAARGHPDDERRRGRRDRARRRCRCSSRSTSTCATSTSPTAPTACAAGTRRSRTPGSRSGCSCPHEGFNRRVGAYASHHAQPRGRGARRRARGTAQVDGWLPSAEDRPGRRRPDGAGVRVRQVRRLDRRRPRPASTTSPSSSTTCTSPRRAWPDVAGAPPAT